jgi:hypothetical protein
MIEAIKKGMSLAFMGMKKPVTERVKNMHRVTIIIGKGENDEEMSPDNTDHKELMGHDHTEPMAKDSGSFMSRGGKTGDTSNEGHSNLQLTEDEKKSVLAKRLAGLKNKA